MIGDLVVAGSGSRDRRSPGPHLDGSGRASHAALADMLRKQITCGALPVDSLLPSERELGAIHAMPRASVRRAMAALVSEGLIVRHRGAGSFVSHMMAQATSGVIVKGDLRSLTSLSADWTPARNGRPTTAEALALALAPHQGVCRFAQVVRAGEIAAVARASIPAACLSRVGTVEGALRCALGEGGARRGLLLHRVRSVRLPASIARAFDLPVSHVALYIERLAFSADGAPILRSSHYLREDRFELLVDLADDAAAGPT